MPRRASHGRDVHAVMMHSTCGANRLPTGGKGKSPYHYCTDNALQYPFLDAFFVKAGCSSVDAETVIRRAFLPAKHACRGGGNARIQRCTAPYVWRDGCDGERGMAAYSRTPAPRPRPDGHLWEHVDAPRHLRLPNQDCSSVLSTYWPCCCRAFH